MVFFHNFYSIIIIFTTTSVRVCLTDYLVARLNVDCYQRLRETSKKKQKQNETKSLTLSAVISELFLSSGRKTVVR